MVETPGERFDDMLVRIPKAAKKVAKKLKDGYFIRKTRKECDIYYRENIEEYEKKAPDRGDKWDYVEDKIDERRQSKKGKRDDLSDYAKTCIQELMTKKFNLARHDIISRDDFKCFKELT